MNCFIAEANNNRSKLEESLALAKKAKIEGKLFEVPQADDVGTFRFPAIADDCNTIIVAGSDRFFESALWHYRDLADTAFGYLPYLHSSPIASDLQLHNTAIAVGALKTRKVISYQPLQVNKCFALFKLELITKLGQTKLVLNLDQTLQVQADVGRLVITYHPDHPFAHTDQFEVEGYAQAEEQKTKDDNPLRLPFPLVKSGGEQLLLRLGASRLTIQSSSTSLSTALGNSYKLPIQVQISKKQLRLITPREVLKRLHS